MSLVATVVDPVTEPMPARWDPFVAEHRLPPVWDSELLRLAAWCDRAPATAVLVSEATSAQPVAAFYVRHPGPASPRRFVRPGRMPAVTIAECRAVPWHGAGMVFAAPADERDRREAVRIFERALRRRVGPGGLLIAYRGLPVEYLRLVMRPGRLQLPPSSHMVLYNKWPDLPGYLAALGRGTRKSLRKLSRSVDEDHCVQVDLAGRVDAADACWLTELVRRRHLPRRFLPPPRPVRYFDRYGRLPGAWCITYRDPQARLLAFAAGHDNGEDLFSGPWGLRSLADGGRRDLYFDIHLRLVALMLHTGRQRLLLGAGMHEIKARYGAVAEPRWAVVGAL
jgi:uncharacterized protein